MGEEQQATNVVGSLLEELFDSKELRRWLGEHFPEVIHNVPGDAASRTEVSEEVAKLLERRGLIGDSFFDRLAEERAKRRKEIDAVRELYTQAATSRPSMVRRSVESRTWERRYHLGLKWTLALAAAWLVTILYPGSMTSTALKSHRDGLFSFVPTFYQRWTFPALITLVALYALVCRFLSPRRKHQTKEKR